MTVLITSFAPWKAHQATNSSDDLIAHLCDRQLLPVPSHLIRHLPVHFQLAPSQVISALYQHRPTTVICCGMAEGRSLLNLERYAHGPSDRFETSLNLLEIADGLQWTTISHDAGDYVCNALYYELLSHIQKNALMVQSLFVHVPPLTDYNRASLVHDFAHVLSRLPTAKVSTQLSAA